MNRASVIVLFLLGFLSHSAMAQSLAQYQFSTGIDTSRWVVLTEPDTLISSGVGDFEYADVSNIGFAFPFAEGSYSQFSVNTDGNLRLGPVATAFAGYEQPFSANNCQYNSPKINVLGCGGYIDGRGYVCCQRFADSLGVDRLVVEYALSTMEQASRSQLLKVQVHLYADGMVEIVYSPDSVSVPPASAHQPGLCVSEHDGWVICSDSVATPFSNGSSMMIPAGVWFAPGRCFQFSRPAFICGRVSGLSISNISSTSAELRFLADSSATEWLVEYAPSYSQLGTPEALSRRIDTTFLLIDSLTPNTSYFVAVRSICDSHSVSASQVGAFTTSHSVRPVGTIGVAQLRPSAVRLNWDLQTANSDFEPDGYRLSLIPTDTTLASIVHFVVSTDTVIGGLVPAASYLISVTSMHGSREAVPANRRLSTPDSSCSAPIVSVTAVVDNGAHVEWVPGFMESDWEVGYRAADETDWTLTDSSTAANGIDIVGLVGGLRYYFRVGTLCGEEMLYDIDSADIASCAAASGFSISQVDTTSALLSWNFSGEKVLVEYGTDGGTNQQVSISSADADSLLLTNLEECSRYYLSFYSICVDGDTVAVFHTSFESGCSCPAVTMLSALETSTDSIVVDWLPLGGEQQWLVEYGLQGFEPGQGTSSTIDSLPMTIHALLPNTSYDIYVYPICDSNSVGRAAVITVRTSVCETPWYLSIGDASSSALSSDLPVNNNFRYSISEIIIKGEELLGLSDLYGIQLEYASSVASTVKDSVELYLMPTTLSHFDTVAQFQPVGVGARKVYSGPLNMVQGWNTIVFDTHYSILTDDNLMLVFVDLSGGYEGYGRQYRTETTAQPMSLIGFGDVEALGVDSLDYSVSTYALSSYRPLVRLMTCSFCQPPTRIAATVDYQSASFSWQGESDQYRIGYRRIGDSEWSDSITITGHAYEIQGLSAERPYLFRVSQVCGGSDYSSWVEVPFRTDSLPCLVPTNLHTTYLTPSSVELEWDETGIGQHESWEIILFNEDTSFWVATSSNPTHVVGLQGNTDYHAAIRYVCSNNTYSDWSDTIQFSTSNCKSVKNFSVSQDSDSSAVLSWQSGGNSTMWELRYGDNAADADTAILLYQISYRMTGLSIGHSYHAQVRSVCGEGVYSDWSDTIGFTATSVGIVERDAMGVGIYPNPTSATAKIDLSYISGVKSVSIFDINGRLLFQVETDSDEMQTPILSQGSYIVTVMTGSSLRVQRLIVR